MPVTPLADKSFNARAQRWLHAWTGHFGLAQTLFHVQHAQSTGKRNRPPGPLNKQLATEVMRARNRVKLREQAVDEFTTRVAQPPANKYGHQYGRWPTILRAVTSRESTLYSF